MRGGGARASTEPYSMILRTVPAAESEPAVFHRDDFVLLIDDMKTWVVRMSDIPVLEACENYTRVHFADGTALIRRSLQYCESRLDSSTFFRASRDCIVNLSHVKQTRLLEDRRLIFVLKDGKEVDFSRRRSLLFRKTRAL
jgi:two-component system, LytTR family, response regulator